MNKETLKRNVDKVKFNTKEALQTVVNELNNGQRKKLVKNEKIKELFDRYGVVI